MKKIHLALAAAVVLALAVAWFAERSATSPPAAAQDAVRPSVPARTSPTTAAADSPIAGTRESFDTLLAGVRSKVEAAQRSSDYDLADRQVDDALLTPGLEPVEKQRLMAVKMGSRGMRGDHAAMLALMDEIIAVAPESPLAERFRKERPQLEKILRLGPNHPELCETCGQVHPPGAHPEPKAARPSGN